MHIILEGADNSGKSFLAKYLGINLELGVVAGEGPEKWPGEIEERAKRYELAFSSTVIFDRHPCVSQPIYGKLYNKPDLPSTLLVPFYDAGHLFIYCRHRGLEQHEARPDVDSAEHLKLIHDNHNKICTQYERWALKHAHICYRIGDNMKQVAAMVKGALVNAR